MKNLLSLLGGVELFCNFAVFLCRSPLLTGGVEGMEVDISFLYGVMLDALCFDNQESGSSHQTVKDKAAVGVHWVCIGTPVVGVSIYISAWASALLVSTVWASQSL